MQMCCWHYQYDCWRNSWAQCGCTSIEARCRQVLRGDDPFQRSRPTLSEVSHREVVEEKEHETQRKAKTTDFKSQADSHSSAFFYLKCNWSIFFWHASLHVFPSANWFSVSFTLIPPQKPLLPSNQGIMSVFEITIRSSCDSPPAELPNLIKPLPLEMICKKCN